MTTLALPESATLYDYTGVTVESVHSELEDALAKAEDSIARAVASASAPSFDETMQPLEDAAAHVATAYGRAGFIGQVHVDPAVRDAGTEAEERINKWRVGVAFRKNLYRAVKAFSRTPEAEALTGERARLLQHWMRDFRRAGQGLKEEARTKLESLRQRLVELEVTFQRNVNEYRDGIEVTREQLAGLPEEYVARLKPGEREGTYLVSLDYPELNPFLEQAHDRGLRRDLFMKHWRRAVDVNRPLLEEALELRRRIAEILGHPTWAHFAMELKMAREPDRVRAFYEQLLPRVEPRIRDELSLMGERLRADGHEGPITAWDWRYYDELLKRTEYGVDQNAVSEYFPLEQVMDGMFAITGEVLGLEYRQIGETRAWHESVRLYEIVDRASGEVLAHFYADLFPRDGKFGHAAAFPLVVARRTADGGYVRPVSAIVANVTPPTPERPALLTHNEVETMWHEFGHILHMSLTRAEFPRFAGAETEWDFVEAPSQIMEHWTWEPSVLNRIARHYRTGEPMPAELLQEMVRARWLNVAVKIGVQAFYGSIDLALHAEPKAPDLDDALRRSYAVTGMPYPEGTFLLSGFAHLMGGYDAGYYGYMWAEVIGDDMFGRFAREGVLSPAVGAEYRREILEPGGSRDGEELVRSFLGRDPSNEEFLRLRGIA